MSCKIEFKSEHKNNDLVSRSEKLLYATVRDKSDFVSRLWEDVKKVPFLKNLEEAEKLFLNYFATDLEGKRYVRYNETSEPKLFYKSSKGKVHETYKEALIDSQEGNVEVGFLDLTDYTKGDTFTFLGENEDAFDITSLENNNNFLSLMTIDNSTDKSSVEGFVNNAILNGNLSGEQVQNMQGESMFAPSGENMTKKVFNGALVYSRASESFDIDRVNKDSFGNVQITEAIPALSGVVNKDGVVETLEETIASVEKDGFDSLVTRTSPEQASDTIIADFIKSGDFEKFFAGFPLMEKQKLSALRDKLFNLINKMGIQLISIEEYKKNYKTKNGIEPDVNALADLANGVIALSSGATIEDLTEELAHFLVETVEETELKNILDDLYLVESAEYQKESQKYREIYSKQGLSEEQLETKVRKEVLGKLIAQGIIKHYKTSTSEQEKGFIDKIVNFLNKIIDRFRYHFLNQSVQVEIQDLVEKIAGEVLNEEIAKSFNKDDISEKYDGVNALYYSSIDDKIRIIDFKRAVDALETRLMLVKDAKVKDINAYRNSVKRASEALINGNQWLTARIVISETENLVKKVTKMLNTYEKNKADSNLMIIKTDHDLLRGQLVPSVENLRGIIRKLETTNDFKEDDRTRLEDQIETIILEQSRNNTKFNEVTDVTNTSMFEEIAKKYGVKEMYLPYIVAALTEKQNDISTLFQLFGNPEHSSIPYIGLLGKILQDNKLKELGALAPLAKKMEKFLSDNKWTHSQYHESMERDEDGNFTHNMLNPVDIAKAEKIALEFETDLYNRLKYKENTAEYVTSEEYKGRYRLDAKGEKTDAIESITEDNLDDFNEFQNEMTKFKEEHYILQYEEDLYRERNAINQSLGLSQATIMLRNNISSDKASAFNRLLNKDGKIDPSKLDKDFEAVDDLNDITARMKNASSSFDVHTNKTYFTVSKEEKETITISYNTKKGEVVSYSYEIPKIIFLDVYDKFNDNEELFKKEAGSDLKIAHDLTKLSLFNQARYANESRTINEKFYEEIADIENFHANEKGFGTYEEAKTRATPAELDELTTNINKTLRKFTEVVGGLGFNEDFYQDLSAMSEGMTRVDKLNSVIDDPEVIDALKDKARIAKSLLIRRGDVLKKYKSRFNPAEIDVQIIPQSVQDDLKSIDERIDSTFNDLRAVLPKSSVDEISEPIASYELNEAFEKDLVDSEMNRVDFMLMHTKNSSSYTHIKSDFRNFETNGVKTSFKTFLGVNGYLNKDGTVNGSYTNAIKTEEGLETVVSDFLSSRVYSYYKRFTPIGYKQWISDLNEGKYYVNNQNTSFGEFLINMSKKQNNESHTLGNKVEDYFKINPALQYTDGSSKSFKDQLNPLYNTDYKDGRIQWNLDKVANKEFFEKFNVDFETYKNNPSQQEEMLVEASKNNVILDFILQTRDLNRLSLEFYGETRSFSPYRIGRTRMTTSETTRNLDKPIDRIQGWYKEMFTTDVDAQDRGAMTADGRALNDIAGKNLRVLPKYGLYDLADMKDVSTDVYYNTLKMLEGAIGYAVKKDTMSDVLKLESALEHADFANNKKGEDSNALKMFKEFVDAQYYGIMRNNKWEVTLMGKKVDLSRVVSAVDRYVRAVNTAWSLAVSVTGLTSSTMFGMTEALTKEHLSDGAFTFGWTESMKDLGNYSKEIGLLDRNNKAYLTARLMGVESFDPLSNATASGRSYMERLLKNPSHKITEVFTNNTGVHITYSLLYDTRFYNGAWYSYNEFRNQRIVNNKNLKEIDVEWTALKDSSLYDNYGFNETNDKIVISEKGMTMMSDYYKNQFKEELAVTGETLTEEELNKKVDSRIEQVNSTLLSSVGGRVASLHSFLEGRVRREQASSATRNAFLNPLLAHRGWFTNTLQRKFKNGQYNFITAQYESGSLNNISLKNPLSIALDLFKSKEANIQYGKEMINGITSPVLSGKQEVLYQRIKEIYGEDEANNMMKIMMNQNSIGARRTGVEVAILTALLMFGTLVAGYVDEPDKKDDFATQYFGYLYFRLASEYGSSNLVTGLPQTVDMANRPAIMFNLFKEIVNEDNYSFNPVRSGAYKGMPKIIAAMTKQTSLRQLYDFGDITKKSQSYRHFNSSSLGGMFGFSLEKSKEEEEE